MHTLVRKKWNIHRSLYFRGVGHGKSSHIGWQHLTAFDRAWRRWRASDLTKPQHQQILKGCKFKNICHVSFTQQKKRQSNHWFRWIHAFWGYCSNMNLSWHKVCQAKYQPGCPWRTQIVICSCQWPNKSVRSTIWDSRGAFETLASEWFL